MEKKVYILCTQFFDRSGTTKKIGGVETYIENLSLLINEQGNKAIVCQFADNNFINEYKNIEIRGYAIRDSIARSRKNRELFKRIKNEIRADDILIFSTDKNMTGRISFISDRPTTEMNDMNAQGSLSYYDISIAFDNQEGL
ncbi:MAG: hypothetical protein RSD04_01780, partial [Clostridia bacterium]